MGIFPAWLNPKAVYPFCRSQMHIAASNIFRFSCILYINKILLNGYDMNRLIH